MSIDRRDVIAGLIAWPAINNPLTAFGLEQCPAGDFLPGTCSALIDPTKFQAQHVADTQKESQWCWAACISMVCRFHGYDLSQESIVKQMYGKIVDMPADDKLLTDAVNREWTSKDNRKFRIASHIFDPILGMADVQNDTIVDDLRNERPLICGSKGHATVVARVDYVHNPKGQPLVLRVHVIDPWPGATNNEQLARFLDDNEAKSMTMGGGLRFLASIKISDA